MACGGTRASCSMQQFPVGGEPSCGFEGTLRSFLVQVHPRVSTLLVPGFTPLAYPLDTGAREIEVVRPTAGLKLDVSAPANGNKPMSILAWFVASYQSVLPPLVTTWRSMSAQSAQPTALAAAVYPKPRLRSDADIDISESDIPLIGFQVVKGRAVASLGWPRR